MSPQTELHSRQMTEMEEKSGRFAAAYSIFQVLLVIVSNAFFLWVCISMASHRKAENFLPAHWLQAGCGAAAVLALVVPVLWLWYGRNKQSDGSTPGFRRTVSMPPNVFMKYIGRSLHLSEAFVWLGLMLFFSGAPLNYSASVPAAALALDVFLLLPWVIRYKAEWARTCLL